MSQLAVAVFISQLSVRILVAICGFSFAALIARADNAALLEQQREVWTQAIVKIEVPIVRSIDGYPHHFIERCSATVISPGPNALLISAWHCFDGLDLLATSATVITDDGPMALELLASGGSMLEDWALLRTRSNWMPSAWIPVSRTPTDRGTRVSAAGFAGPSESERAPADNIPQRTLLIDTDCRVTETGSLPVATNCVVRQGASGGAILGRTPSGSYRVFGVISSGDGESVSYFYPADLLSSKLNP